MGGNADLTEDNTPNELLISNTTESCNSLSTTTKMFSVNRKPKRQRLGPEPLLTNETVNNSSPSSLYFKPLTSIHLENRSEQQHQSDRSLDECGVVATSLTSDHCHGSDDNSGCTEGFASTIGKLSLLLDSLVHILEAAANTTSSAERDTSILIGHLEEPASNSFSSNEENLPYEKVELANNSPARLRWANKHLCFLDYKYFPSFFIIRYY